MGPTVKVTKLPPNKIKPPDIYTQPPYKTYTPTKSHRDSSQALSYSNELLKTPTQTTGKRKLDAQTTGKRKLDDCNQATPHRSRNPPFQTTPGIPTPPSPRPHVEPLVLVPDSQFSDHVMEDPFTSASHSQDLDWSDELFYSRVNKIQSLLKDLHVELDCARNEQNLALVLEDEDVEEQLIKLSAILPSYTSNSMVTPVMKGPTSPQEMMGQLSDRLVKLETTNLPTHQNKTLAGSIHAVPSYATTTSTPPPPPLHMLSHPRTPPAHPNLPINARLLKTGHTSPNPRRQ